MNTKEDLKFKELIEDEHINNFNNDREKLRQSAKQSILKIQAENKRPYNLRWKPARKYNVGDLVVIKRTQISGGQKLKPKYLGPYEVTFCKYNDCYDVKKVGLTEGLKITSTCDEYMKPCTEARLSFEQHEGASETNAIQDGRYVGNITERNWTNYRTTLISFSFSRCCTRKDALIYKSNSI